MMSTFLFIVLMLTMAIVCGSKLRNYFQKRYIKQFIFPHVLKNKLKRKYPDLDDDQLDLVFQGLRDYFELCRFSKRKMVAMPSQVVDAVWHEFILLTRDYQRFCQKAIGRFLHHTPAEAMRNRTHAQKSIKRAWRLACLKENINPKQPSHLPLLFAIDKLLDIENGFYYSLDCRQHTLSGARYCAGDIGCGSDSGGDSGNAGDNGGDSGSHSGGCSSGCGGD